jgi:uncharacterized membrane protein YdbT with pleckstrin-like domain
MRYLASVVQSGETIIYDVAVPNWELFARASIFIVLGLVLETRLGDELAGLMAMSTFPEETIDKILMLIGAIVILCALYSIIKGGMIEIGITNHRIIYKTGIVARDVLEIELASIDSIRVRQTFFERLFDRGRLVVRSVGGAVITTEPVRHPLRLRGSIMALEEEAEAALPVAD